MLTRLPQGLIIKSRRAHLESVPVLEFDLFVNVDDVQMLVLRPKVSGNLED